MIGRPQLSDGGMSVYNPKPKPTNRMPNYNRPAPATPSWSPANSYVAPIANYAPPAPVQNWAPQPAAITNWGGGGGVVNQSAPVAKASVAPAAAPVEPPKPKMTDDQWLSGDTEYQNEIKGYDDTLKDFLSRITTQETDFKTDYGTAVKGFGRNRDRSMLNLGEDFTARGLANSGMFADSRKKADAQFEDQETGMTTAKDRGLADFGNQRKDKERSTGTQKGNARRASLARMAQKQEF